MTVIMKESICGLKAGAVVSVSAERGLLWIQRGYAGHYGEAPKPVKAEPVIEAKAPEVLAKQTTKRGKSR